MNNSGIKLSLEPRGVAHLFLCSSPIVQMASQADVLRLELILKEVWDSAMRAALVRAKEEYKKRHSGGCKILSQGDDCQCFLCAMDNLLQEITHDGAPPRAPAAPTEGSR